MIISAAEEMNPSRRSTMEDCHVIHESNTWNCGYENMTYLGVYDGHGGRDIAEFLEDNLSSNIANELRYGNKMGDDGDNVVMEEEEYDSNDDYKNATILQRMECAFLLTDIQSFKAGIRTSGATAAVCLVQVGIFQM